MDTHLTQRKVSKTMPSKVISPLAHGVIDYAHSAFFFTLGLLCTRANKRAAAVSFATSGLILVQSLLTDYRLGWGFQRTTAARIFVANSIAEASVVAMTDWDSERAHQERGAT
jgi:hypothetical protein